MRFFDKLEDKVRVFLSHYPLAYAFVAGVGLVLFWRGVWHTADGIAELIWQNGAHTSIDLSLASPFWDGPVTLVIGSVILLLCGVFVSELLGKEIIISGLRGERKLAQKTESEVRSETGVVGDILQEVHVIAHRLDELEKRLEEKAGRKK